MQPSVERIIALKPQIVLISTASQLETFTKQLNEQRIAIYVTNPNSVDQVLSSIETLGNCSGQRSKPNKSRRTYVAGRRPWNLPWLTSHRSKSSIKSLTSRCTRLAVKPF